MTQKKQPLNEGKFFDKLVDIVVRYQTDKYKRIISKDPEIQKGLESFRRAHDEFKKMVDDYCKKYDC